MDPTAPNNNSNSQDPPASNIEPGQFVVTEAQNQNPPIPNNPIATPSPFSAGSLDPTHDLANMNLSSSAQSPPQVPPPANIPPSAPPPPPPIPTMPDALPNQPDPTPFSPNIQPVSPPTQGKSMLSRYKLIFIIVAVLLLVAITAGVVWFFVLGGNKPKEDVKTDSSTQPAEDVTPPTKRTAGGFGEIPQATSEATSEAPLEFPIIEP